MKIKFLIPKVSLLLKKLQVHKQLQLEPEFLYTREFCKSILSFDVIDKFLDRTMTLVTLNFASMLFIRN